MLDFAKLIETGFIISRHRKEKLLGTKLWEQYLYCELDVSRENKKTPPLSVKTSCRFDSETEYPCYT